MQDAGCEMWDAGWKIWDAECGILDAECLVGDAGYGKRDAKNHHRHDGIEQNFGSG